MLQNNHDQLSGVVRGKNIAGILSDFEITSFSTLVTFVPHCFPRMCKYRQAIEGTMMCLVIDTPSARCFLFQKADAVVCMPEYAHVKSHVLRTTSHLSWSLPPTLGRDSSTASYWVVLLQVHQLSSNRSIYLIQLLQIDQGQPAGAYLPPEYLGNGHNQVSPNAALGEERSQEHTL